MTWSPWRYNTHFCLFPSFEGNWEGWYGDNWEVLLVLWETVAGPKGYYQNLRLRAWPMFLQLVGGRGLQLIFSSVKILIPIIVGVFGRKHELRNSPFTLKPLKLL